MAARQDDAGRRQVGRRPGGGDSRETIARAARELFAAHGYDATSVRAIAQRAGVDPALVTYFFGTKQDLFMEVLDLPVDPATVVHRIVDGDRAGVGERLARVVASVLAAEDTRQRLVAVIRSASAENEAAELVRRKLTAEILEPVAAQLGAPDSRFRAGLAMSQVVGMTFARHVVGIDSLVDASSEDLVRALAPTLQRYLAGDLDG